MNTTMATGGAYFGENKQHINGASFLYTFVNITYRLWRVRISRQYSRSYVETKAINKNSSCDDRTCGSHNFFLYFFLSSFEYNCEKLSPLSHLGNSIKLEKRPKRLHIIKKLWHEML